MSNLQRTVYKGMTPAPGAEKTAIVVEFDDRKEVFTPDGSDWVCTVDLDDQRIAMYVGTAEEGREPEKSPFNVFLMETPEYDPHEMRVSLADSSDGEAEARVTGSTNLRYVIMMRDAAVALNRLKVINSCDTKFQAMAEQQGITVKELLAQGAEPKEEPSAPVPKPAEVSAAALTGVAPTPDEDEDDDDEDDETDDGFGV